MARDVSDVALLDAGGWEWPDSLANCPAVVPASAARRLTAAASRWGSERADRAQIVSRARTAPPPGPPSRTSANAIQIDRWSRQTERVAPRKRISDEQHDGGLGEDLAGLLIGEMGHEFHPTRRNEAGIDGFIELRHGGSGEVSAQILFCQVKTGKTAIFDETVTEFSWRADPGDVVYWENSNLPAIVIVVRLATRGGWWRSVDEAFPDEAARAARVIRFNKVNDRLDGAPGEVLWNVVRRARDRRAVAARMAMAGPYATIGLGKALEAAQQFERENLWSQAADAWTSLADGAAERRLERRLVWPALEAASRAYERENLRTYAGRLWLRLAAERVDDDDPEASFNIGRARWTAAWTGSFAQALIEARAQLPEAGVYGLDRLRTVATMAAGARERQAAAAALADALVFFGRYEEALTVAERVLAKKHDTPHKRQLILDRLDCAGELGLDVDADWHSLLEDWRDRGPHLYGRALQRRAVFELRRGNPEEARARFIEAAEVWARTDGGEEQVAEVGFSTSMVGELSGQLLEPDAMPPGARAAAAIARGSIRTPAVRSDRLLQDGLAFLVDNNRPDALSRLTLAAMVDRRAGNLFSWRRTGYLLARAYEDADEYGEALRFWLLVGAELRTAEVAPKVDTDTVLALVRLDSGPAWERASGFAALERHAQKLSPQIVASLAPALVTASQPTPRLVAPQPSFYARRTLALICDRLPSDYAETAGRILAEDVHANAPNAPESSRGLAALTERGLFDGMPVIVEALLAGDRLPVSVAAWLADASVGVRRQLVDAALDGNQIALAEVAAADLAADDPKLREACDRVIRRLVDAERAERAETIGMSFVEFADLARYSDPSHPRGLRRPAHRRRYRRAL